MTMSVVNRNILDSSAEAIILTIDGAKKGMEGNIARAFAKKYPNAWELLEYEITYPIPIGMAKIFNIEDDDDCNQKFCIIASTLHHLDVLEQSSKRNIINSALRYALTQANNHQLKSLCTTIMKGGWRLELEDALVQMITTYSSFANAYIGAPRLEVCIDNVEEYKRIATFAEAEYSTFEVLSDKEFVI